MSGLHVAPAEQQPESFAFTPENRALADKIIAKYPAGRQASAVLPLLDLAQRQAGGWLPQAAVRHVADLLAMPMIRAWEVATFYSMFNLAPTGRHLLQVCTTTPCWLRGSEAVVEACARASGAELGHTSADGMFTLREVECLGACVNAPMMQIGDDFYEDLTPESAASIVEALRRGERPKPGPQSGRMTSSPAGGLTTLTSLAAKGGE
jgi:NADH-quinone oxidoreductase subunit E